MSLLGRIARVDVREVEATAETAVASLLPSSGSWPASPNVSRCLKWLKGNIKRMKNNENESGGGRGKKQKKQHSQRLERSLKKLAHSIYSPEPAVRKAEMGSHLASICFTVPVIWFIFSSKREMASLFCLELASAVCRGNVRMFGTKRGRGQRPFF